MSDPAALKAQLKRLADQRSALEADIAVRSGRLEAAGVGMDASLVDAQVRSEAGQPGAFIVRLAQWALFQHGRMGGSKRAHFILSPQPCAHVACVQGYPRADVDVAAIRADRHAIISELFAEARFYWHAGCALVRCLLDERPGSLTMASGATSACQPSRRPEPTRSVRSSTKRSPNERPQSADATDGAAAAPAACRVQPARWRSSSNGRPSSSSGGSAGSASRRPCSRSTTGAAAAPCSGAATLCSGG